MKEMKIKEIVAEWQREKRDYVKASTYGAYMFLVNTHLLPEFGECTQLQECAVQQFVVRKINEGLSRKYVRDLVMVLTMIRRYGVKHGWLEYADWDIRYPSAVTSSLPVVLTVSEHRKLIRYVQNNFSFRNLGIGICLLTGMRIGEICALRWSDFNLTTDTVTVSRTLSRIYVCDNPEHHTNLIVGHPKTAKSLREIPLVKLLADMLRPLLKQVDRNNYVLSNSTNPIEPRTYRNYFTRLMKELGFRHIKFHGLRHSFATRCIETGCDYKTVSALLGHANISTTLNLYVHPNIEHKKKCVDRVAKAICQ